MGHRINDVIHADTNSQSGELLVVARVIGPFPGISHVRLKGHGDYQSAAVIVNAAPARRATGAFLRHAGPDITRAGYLIPVTQVVDVMEDLIAIGDVDYFTLGKNAAHTLHEVLPLRLAPEVVAHEE